MTRPDHRLVIFTIGLTLFALGGLANAVLFNAAGVLVFMACLLLSRPLHDIAYFPIQMQVIDTVSAIEKRNKFAYIFNQEFGLHWPLRRLRFVYPVGEQCVRHFCTALCFANRWDSAIVVHCGGKTDPKGLRRRRETRRRSAGTAITGLARRRPTALIRLGVVWDRDSLPAFLLSE
jgi:hypothetical protein